MPSSIEEIDSLSSEDRLGPPKYDMIGVLMVFLSMLIIGVMVGIGILLLIYLVLGEFTIESGASPVLLAFVTFMVLTFGNMLYVFILGKIFPHAYSRSRTSLSQTMLASIVLYIVFIPVYLLLSTAQPTGSSYILWAFAAHVVASNFVNSLLLGIVSQYRYSLLVFYGTIIGTAATIMVVMLIHASVGISETSKTLFLLLGLTVVSYVFTGTITSLVSWMYYALYQVSGYDPLGSVLEDIEKEEKMNELLATEQLTNFRNKK